MTTHPSWGAGYRALADGVGLSATSVTDAAAAVEQLIGRVDAASGQVPTSYPGHEPDAGGPAGGTPRT